MTKHHTPEDAADHQPGARRKRLSDFLVDLSRDESRDRLSVQDLLEALDGRAIAAMLLIFAGPNVLPTPPGTSGILGLPLTYLSAQMMLGHIPWLPGFIANRSLARGDFTTMVDRSAPLLARAEKLLAPRLLRLSEPWAVQLIGLVCFILSVVLMLPIPLGNMLPALAICVLALGVLERDGMWILLGLGLAVASLAVVSGVILAFIKAAVFLFAKAL